MTVTRYPTILAAWVGLAASPLIGCHPAVSIADKCASAYPRPTADRVAHDTNSIPAPPALTLFHPSDSLPRLYKPDSSVGWFRDLFYAHFSDFPGGPGGVNGFLLRFHARIIGLADTAGWYAVRIPDPGPDTARFNLLRFCIGADHGVYVRPAYSRAPSLFRRS